MITPRTRQALIDAVEGIDLMRLTEAAATIDYAKVDILAAYQPVVLHFMDVATMMTYENFAAAAAMVFGFLDERVRLVHLEDGRNEDVAEIANAASTRWDIELLEIGMVADAFGGRLSPTSLLLHFCNPDRYAWWNEEAFAFAVGREPYAGELDDLELYGAYLEHMRGLATSIQAQQITKLVRVVSPEITRMGAVQVVLYAAGR